MGCIRRRCGLLSGFAILALACQTPDRVTSRLAAVRSWAIQLQGLGSDAAIDALARAPASLLVIEPTRSIRGQTTFPTRTIVRRLQNGGQRLCFAYLNVGQAEDYRGYWQPDWQAPHDGARGSPAFLLTTDPEGWPGNYPVAYWHQGWRAILMGHPNALLDQILADGFDGAYLDWVLGYSNPVVAEAAAADGVDPADAMVTLIERVRDYARTRRPEFSIIAQNAAFLVERAPQLLDTIDGLAQEDLSFRGEADAAWDDARAGDIATHSQALLEQLLRSKAHGLPIFTLDYALESSNAATARRISREHGFVPYVARTPLDRLAEP
ncbi:MAG: endo alpha-1,4 polygalactosaminidase [Planctomycetota bacterium]